MQIELMPIGGKEVGQFNRMVLDRGRKTLGRGPDCDWKLPQDLRVASKLHCIVERQGDRFQLVDRSSNGTWVDGVLVQDGASAPLADGSRVTIGNLELAVSISGQPSGTDGDFAGDYALSDEPLTISAILSDIVPGGRIAGGILGASETAELPVRPSIAIKGVSSSRNVEIGWSGPPDPRDFGTILPADWDADPTSEFGGLLEHGAATQVSISVAPKIGGGQAKAPSQLADGLPESGSTAVAQDSDAALTPLVDRLERQVGLLSGLLGCDDGTSADTLTDRVDIDGRLIALLTVHERLHANLDRLLSNSDRIFNPRMIEARVDAQSGLPLGPLQALRYWRIYRAQFVTDGRNLSAFDLMRAGVSADPLQETPGRAGLAKQGKTSDEE
ncbi:FHA domain-containing protein [Rhizobium sp. AAP43]|uniref:FHA domain-containing protein n=1 Tax=Rhizobium sp. AAP43 TaxID=1523420 RepID=UPI0006B9A6BB|nr:FHA domain-containing protein [Rhizobium sp. AAP43]